jgi:hypothetical protein
MLDTLKLTSIVGVILALSIASERLVEIAKGLVPPLNEKGSNERSEGRRRAALQALAVVAGIITAFLARDYIPVEVARPTETWSIIGLGLLASGGSGFWNSVLSYLTNVKDVKKVDAIEAKRRLTQSP